MLLILIFKKMKKTILAVAFMAVAMVSCGDKKVEGEPTVGTEIGEKIDTVAQKTEEVIDTTQAKAGEALEEGAEKLDEAGKELKEAAKK
ncbi:hypothetical protein GCM10028861_03760 [Flavobacterium koreense]